MGTKDFERPFSMRGLTTKIKTPHGSMFVTINFYESQMKEVFVVVSKPGSELRACAEALGRVISLALQKGVPPEDIRETLENIKTEEVAWNNYNGQSFPVSSIPDGISKAIKFATSLKFPPDAWQGRREGDNRTERNNQKIWRTIETSTSLFNETENSESDAKTNSKPSRKKEKKNIRSLENKMEQVSRKMEICPSCHSSSLVFQEGCFICMNCGYTKCS